MVTKMLSHSLFFGCTRWGKEGQLGQESGKGVAAAGVLYSTVPREITWDNEFI
jgi:hypothetical protein